MKKICLIIVMVLMGIGSIKAEENESNFLSDLEDVVLSD